MGAPIRLKLICAALTAWWWWKRRDWELNYPQSCATWLNYWHLIEQELWGELIRGWKEGDKTPGPDLIWFYFVVSTLDPVVWLSPWAKVSSLLSRLLGFGVIEVVYLKFPEDWVSEWSSSMKDLEQGKAFFVGGELFMWVFLSLFL